MNKMEKEEAKARRDSARAFLLSLKGRKVYAKVNWVSQSGMSRRIEFYVIMSAAELDPKGYYKKTEPEIERIGWYIAQAKEMKYDADKGGILVKGCGMDMIFHVLSNLNYAAASWELGPDYMKIIREKDPDARVYDRYLFNADEYGHL